ncbi:hypothetical protein [Peribacillus sp. FSL E2-0218]|uniref:hypothetical protein n=1 Tax=Peribacillus sp. FSL E2-0218 TaxID=2921364 RepID=UPI0030EF0A58
MARKHSYFFKIVTLKYLKGVLFLLIASFSFFLIYKCFQRLDISKPGTSAWVGVIVGSLVSGFLSYLGAERVKVREIKKQEMKERKVQIYVPLYEDLLGFDNYLKSKPYPNTLTVETFYADKAYSFTEWTTIKTDSRFLSVNPKLKNDLNKLEELIVYYDKLKDDFTYNVFKVIDRYYAEECG